MFFFRPHKKSGGGGEGGNFFKKTPRQKLNWGEKKVCGVFFFENFNVKKKPSLPFREPPFLKEGARLVSKGGEKNQTPFFFPTHLGFLAISFQNFFFFHLGKQLFIGGQISKMFQPPNQKNPPL